MKYLIDIPWAKIKIGKTKVYGHLEKKIVGTITAKDDLQKLMEITWSHRKEPSGCFYTQFGCGHLEVVEG